MIQRYKEAFARALPHLPRVELTFRLHFVMGALSYTLAGTDALRLFTQIGAAADKENDEMLLQRLAPFLVAGLKAPAMTPWSANTHLVLRYDPVTQAVSASVEGVELGSFVQPIRTPRFIGIEGVGLVDDLVVRKLP